MYQVHKKRFNLGTEYRRGQTVWAGGQDIVHVCSVRPVYDPKGFTAQLKNPNLHYDPILALLVGDYQKSMRRFAKEIIPSFDES